MEIMSSAERLTALLEGGKPDRVPVMASVGGYAAMLYGLSLKDFYTDIEQCIKVQLLAKELHGYDDSPGYGWADWGGWEFGGAIAFPESYVEMAPRVVDNPVSRPSDVDRLRVPDPRSAGMFPLLMEFNRRMRVMGFDALLWAGSVTSVVSSIIGKERLLRWYIKEPEAVRTVYEKAAAFILKAADMITDEFGSRNCTARISAPMDSNNLISARIFESFALPYLKQVNQALMERGVKRFSVHICGNHEENLEAWTQLPWPPRTIFSIGEMDIHRISEAFGHNHIIGGNISTTLLALGSHEEVFEAARFCIEQGKDLPGGFILMPACTVPVLAPPLNIQAMVKAAREFGRYG